ncbi:ABC transporter permease [Nocardioides sp. cx-173]|uniref:ABC transporter permease n=1 Tax=Nocardioides sp. cx-173 TaxID=2898796 RepID=UPI001E2C6145|nr:ABC transporter permease [Nocardioides sp. cx-173]MCD4523312.1 ABC transporter permease [Nocardioides sp. cx-173]UGB42347.1 ABC transporter permease [Nocardioides sp. cx-173]
MTLPAALVTAAVSGREPPCYANTQEANEWLCWQYVEDRRSEILDALVWHVQITLAALVLATLLAFPLALLARRLPRAESWVLGSATAIYTIPSLALFPLFLPFTGISATTVVLGLALYALTVLVRAILDGLRSVPDEVRESAVGLGYGPGRLLLKVELPLALPVIVAGLRVATVSTVALTTVGSLVERTYGGLGRLIAHGVDADFRAELVTASVLCVLLALVLDAVLVLVQRLLTPWTRGTRT